MSPADRTFVDAVAAIDYLNPFLPERTEHERAALGPEFDEAHAGWQLAPDEEDESPNVRLITERAEAVVHAARERLAGGARPDADELRLYGDLVVFHLYHRHRTDLAGTVTKALAGGDGRAVCGFYPRFAEEHARLLELPGVDVPERHPPEHLFAFLFQISRAFQLIFGFVRGGSPAAIRLRASIWQSVFTHDLRRYVRSLSDRLADVTTLVTGPSGTGKELVARAIGHASYIPFEPRSRRFTRSFTELFHALHLAALSPTIVESELFGHRKGAFTGALDDHRGWFEVSDAHGAVFLDEIGEIGADLQVKLLRVLETRRFQRLGETAPRTFEGRVLCATNRDLLAEIRAGRFREDLYYRMCSDVIVTPSLAEQIGGSDSERSRLVHFIARRMLGDDGDALAEEVEAWIDGHLGRDYPWPGNFRELEQCVRNVLIRGEYHPSARGGRAVERSLASDVEEGRLTLDELVRRYTNLVHRQAGSYEAAARRLGVDRRTVKSRMGPRPD